MSQLIPVIPTDPNVTSGTQLASILDGFVAAYKTGNAGSARPSNLAAGGNWIDDSTAGSDGLYKYNFYDGTNDIVLFTINKNTQQMILAASENNFSISRITDDSVGPVLTMIKKRILSGGQTKDGDALGRIDFSGVSASGVSYVQASIRVFVTDDVTATDQGSRMSFFVTDDETASLIEKMRLSGDGKLGVGTTSPAKSIHVFGEDSDTALKISQVEASANPPEIILNKKRIATNGQVLSADKIGVHKFTATDENGAEVEVAKIEVIAAQNISSTAQGTDLIISTKLNGATSYTEAIKISNGVLSFFGTQQLDSSAKATLLDDAATRNLFSINGSVYGAFCAEVMILGRDNAPSVRAQKTFINGVYNTNSSTWEYNYTHEVITDTEKVVVLAFTNGASLVIDYVNQFVAANFLAGSIFLKVRRFAA